MDGFTTKRSTSSKDPQLRAIHFTGGKCLGERSSGSRTWTYSIEEQGGSKENSQKNTGMFVQRLKVGGKSWESTLRYQLIYTTYIYIWVVFFLKPETQIVVKFPHAKSRRSDFVFFFRRFGPRTWMMEIIESPLEGLLVVQRIHVQYIYTYMDGWFWW